MRIEASQTIKGVTVVLAGLAAALAGLLLYQSQTLSPMPGCGGGSSCETVLTSKWSMWLGLPVSLLAMGVYVAMLCGVIMRDTQTHRPQRAAQWVMLFSGMAVIFAAIWFFFVQAGIIRLLCIYCMTTHLCAVAAGVLCLLTAQPGRWIKGTATAASAALGLVAVLIAGQVLGDEPAAAAPTVQYDTTMQDSSTPNGASSSLFDDPLESHLSTSPIPMPDSTSSTEKTPTPTPKHTTPTEPRKLSFYGGRFTIDTTDVPIIGDPYAPTVMVIAFDYTCPHCRTTREMLEKTKRKFGDKLAIVCLPVPLGSKCNKLVRRTSKTNRYACELAEASLAVWRMAPQKWAEFDHLLITDDQSRTAARAQIAAWELLGGEKVFEMGRTDPWVKKRIETDVRIYEVAGKASGSSYLPMLFTKSGIMTGAPRHPLDIDDFLAGRKVLTGGDHTGHAH